MPKNDGKFTALGRNLLSPSAWLIYLIIVFEFIYMITPFGLYFYSAYAPVLNTFTESAWTAWLTGFFLPHFSMTESALVSMLRRAGWWLAYAGLAWFVAAAVQLYWSKFFRRGLQTGGLYRFSRHPQYTALAVLGLGTLLIWPRFIVLVTFVTMMFLYGALARHEERECEKIDSTLYEAYKRRTGMFLPRIFAARSGLTKGRGHRPIRVATTYAVALVFALAIGFTLREHTLSSISALYLDRITVVSPALLEPEELERAYALASSAEQAAALIENPADRRSMIVYIVPESWYLPDLPLDAHEIVRKRSGHATPSNFDRGRYRVLYTLVRSHSHELSGRDILRKSYAKDPLLIVDIDLNDRRIVSVSEPPSHVVWGDFPTPLI